MTFFTRCAYLTAPVDVFPIADVRGLGAGGSGASSDEGVDDGPAGRTLPPSPTASTVTVFEV